MDTAGDRSPWIPRGDGSSRAPHADGSRRRRGPL